MTLPSIVATPGAAGDLGEQLEGALGGAEVGQAEREIGADHAHQRDAVHVVALGDHLGADQQVDFAGLERAQHALEVGVAAHRVAVHASDARGGKRGVQEVFQLL